MINISAAQARPLVDHINEMLAVLKKLGPSPLKSTNTSKNAEMRI
jgi:coenzyme F420-reducing hydrogenase delta subunit